MSSSPSASQPTGEGSSNPPAAPKLSSKAAYEAAKRAKAAALAAAKAAREPTPGEDDQSLPSEKLVGVPTWPTTEKGKAKAVEVSTAFRLADISMPFNLTALQRDLPYDSSKVIPPTEEPDVIEESQIDPLRRDGSRTGLKSDEMWVDGDLENMSRALKAASDLEKPWSIRPDFIHRNYRGSDRPRGFNGAKKGSNGLRLGKLQPHANRPAAVAFWQNDGGSEVFGDIFAPAEASGQKCPIYVQFVCDSMMPYMQLEIENPFGGRHIYVHIFSNHISQTNEHPVRAMVARLSLRKREKLIYDDLGKKKPNMDAEARAGRLVEFKIKLHTETELEESGKNFRTMKITGDIDQAGLDLLVNQLHENLAGVAEEAEPMTESARLLAMIHAGHVHDLSIYVGFTEREDPLVSHERHQWKNFCGYFRTVMIASLKLGNYWIIHKQLDQDWLNPSFQFDLTNAPRYLVNSWGPEKLEDDNGNFLPLDAPPEDLAPEQRSWASFEQPPTWPSPDEPLFLLRLAITREREFQYKYVKKLFDANQGQISAHFRANSSDNRSFVVEFITTIDRSKLRWIIPEVDTRLSIGVEGVGRFYGKVIETPKTEISANFCAIIVTTVPQAFSGVYRVTVNFLDDSTAFIRASHALAVLSRNHDNRKTGIHVRHLLLGDKIPADHKPLALSAEDVAKYRSHISPTLDNSQFDAATQIYEEPSGGILIHGPPGTGKTYTVLCAISALLSTDKKVLVTAPTNETVKYMVDVWDRLFSEELDQMWCVWRGGFLKQGVSSILATPKFAQKSHLTAVKESTLREADEAFWRQDSKDSAASSDKSIDQWRKRGFAVRRWQRIKLISEDRTHALHQQAVEYVALMDHFYELDDREKTTILAYEEDFNREFLAQCRLVFSTCSMSWHENLREWFKPDTVFVDEAGGATLPDLMMPIVGFQDTIQRVVLSGDYKQQPSGVTSQTCNEAVSMLTTSHFQVLVDEIGWGFRKDQRIAVRILQTQY